jgi:ABC-type lipoprotein release transport system permease subunit
MIFILAWRNIWRNKQRTLITMASVFFAVILSILLSSLQIGVFENLINNIVSFYSGYVQIHKSGYWNERIIDNSFRLSSDFYSLTGTDKRVKGVVPRLESFGLGSNGDLTKGLMIIGTEPEPEDFLTSLKSKVIRGNYLDDSKRSSVMSEGLAKKLQLDVGDSVVLLSQGYHGAIASGKFAIEGIVKFGSPELNDKSVYIPLKVAQEMFSAENMVTSAVLLIDNPEEIGSIKNNVAAALGNKYEVMTWEEMMPEITQHLEADRAGFFIISGILYLIIAFGIFGTVLMMTCEREYEFGVLVSIGMKKKKLSTMLILETIMIAIAGVIGGAIVSIPLIYYFHNSPLRITGDVAKVYEQFGFEAVFPTSTDPSHIVVQALIILCIALLISVYPTFKILLMNPVESMKK